MGSRLLRRITASIRVMDKAGLRFERATVHREKPHVLYRIDA
ncbi:MAG TPA: hypothetical protein VGL61_06620 [Kofleriaceae bacterium]